MPQQALNAPETREMLLYVCERMEQAKDELTRADQAIGDGDHGVGMVRGFAAARAKLAAAALLPADAALRTVGMALLGSIGGAAGAVFGTLFMAGGAAVAGAPAFGSLALSRFLSAGMKAVMERGKAQPGQKTMLDALAPAVATAAELKDRPLAESLPAVAQAAQQGVEATKSMIATTGKAKTLGERSLGYPDPGAVSTAIILRSMAEYVATL